MLFRLRRKSAAGQKWSLQATNGIRGWLRLGDMGASSLIILIIRIAQSALLFAISVLLSRALGPQEYGVYAFSAALLGIMIVPASLGFENLLAADLPIMTARGQNAEIRELVSAATRVALLSAMAIFCVWVFLAILQLPILDPPLWRGGAFALTALLPLAAMKVRLGTLRGQHRTVQGQLPIFVFQPAFMLVIALGCFAWGADRSNGVTVSAFFALSFLGAYLLSILAMPPLFGTPSRRADARHGFKLLPRALPFLVIGGVAVFISQIGVLMLGAVLGPKEAGLYQPAALLAAFVSMAHNIINQPLGPRVAQLSAENRRDVLQRTLDRAFLAGLGFGLPVALVLMLGGKVILQLFGAEFVDANAALILLAGGQLLSVSLGPGGIPLMMMGHQKLFSKLMAAAAVLCFLFNALLIPLWGVEGAALAALLTVAFWSIAASYLAARLLGLRSSFLTGWLVRRPADGVGVVP